jgi:uncharacterized protein (TIGR02996 family)
MSLEKALASAKAGKTADTLNHLLAAWREKPTAPLTEAVLELARLAEAEEPPILGKTPSEKAAAWQQRANEKRPASLGLLLALAMDTKGSAQTQERLTAIVGWSVDPRLADFLGKILEKPPYNGSVSRTTPFWKFVFGWLPKMNDPRLLDRARQLPKAWEVKELSDYEREALNRRLAKAMPELEAAYGGGVPVLSDADAARCREIVEAAKKIGGGAAEQKSKNVSSQQDLLDEVYAHPDDDGPRLVLADLLQEQGDPRGEFIALQFLKEPTKEQQKRQDALVAEYGRAWLGPIAPNVLKSGLEFERGFPAVCSVKTIDTCREWSTLRELTGPIPDLEGMHLSSVRTVTSGAMPGLDRIPHLEELRLTGVYVDVNLRKEKPFAQLINYDNMSGYTSLKTRLKRLRLENTTSELWSHPCVDPSLFDWAFSGPGQQLEELMVTAPLGQLDAWRAVAKKKRLKRLTLRTSLTQSRAFRLVIEGDRLRIEGKPMKLQLQGVDPIDIASAEVLMAALNTTGPFSAIELVSWKPAESYRRALTLSAPK